MAAATSNGNQETGLRPKNLHKSPIIENIEILEFKNMEENDYETDLTSLSWLTELRNQNITFGNSLALPAEDEKCCLKNNSFVRNTSANSKSQQLKSSKPSGASGKNVTQQIQNPMKRASPAERYKIFLDKIKRDLSEYKQSAVIYQTNAAEKPPFNYSHIIGMAMLENGRVTLQQICNWIEEKFAFFRIRKKWNNSIRHNLSLHYCFRKIDRNKFDKGKGGYWELGVDPKKCERKRIRNRKTTRNKYEKICPTIWSTLPNVCELHKTTSTVTEFLENVDMPVLNNSIHVQNIQDNVSLESLGGQQCVSADDVFSQPVAEISNKCQQFLGTIIINASEADNSTSSLNFLGSGFDWPLHHMNGRECIAANIPENTVGPSCDLDSTELENRNTVSPKTSTETLQNQNMILSQFNILPGSSLSLLRPNVIVEQVLQTQTSTTENIASIPVPVLENCGPFVDAGNNSFRPDIDGIEEAFQYLRSIDQNNREDILDNILDISVSDY